MSKPFEKTGGKPHIRRHKNGSWSACWLVSYPDDKAKAAAMAFVSKRNAERPKPMMGIFYA